MQTTIAFVQYPPPMETHDWDELRLFLAVWRARSLNGAARELSVNVSTTSRRLEALEDRLGRVLFERRPTGLTATAAAEALVGPATEVELAVAKTQRALEGLEATPVGRVTVTCLPTVGESVVAPLLARLAATYPDLQVSLDVAGDVRNLGRNDADLAVRATRPMEPDLVRRRVLDAPWVLAAATPLVAQLGVLNDLSGLPLIDWSAPYASARPSAWLRRVAPTARRTLESNSLAAQLTAARSGAGLVLVVEPMLAQLPGLSAVRMSPAFQKQWRWPRESLWLVTHRTLRHVPRVAVTWDAVVAEFANLSRGRTS